MNTTSYPIVFLTFIVLSLSISCTPQEEYITVSYEAFYRVTSIQLSYQSFRAECPSSPDTDAESRAFYEAADTSLTFRLHKPSPAHPERGKVAAIDWRITGINVITLENLDKNHPAGSSMNNILNIEYEYKNKRCLLPLTEVKYGTIMLSDYFPYDPEWSLFTLRPFDERMQMPRIEVRIDDAFGRTLTAQSPDNYQLN